MAIRQEILAHKITVDNREALAKIGEYTKSVEGAVPKVNRATGGMTGGFTALRGSMLGALGVVGAIGGAIAVMNRLAATAERVDGLSRGFETLSARVGETSDSLLGSMRAASRGFVADADLMQQANNAILLGLPVTAESMGELTDAAVKLSRAMGIDVAQGLESLVVGIGRQSRLWLDNLGIVVDTEAAYKRYADSLGVTVDSLTEAQQKLAFYNATIDAADVATTGLAVQTDTLSSSYSKLAVQVKNASDEVIKFVNSPAFAAAFGFGPQGGLALAFGRGPFAEPSAIPVPTFEPPPPLLQTAPPPGVDPKLAAKLRELDAELVEAIEAREKAFAAVNAEIQRQLQQRPFFGFGISAGVGAGPLGAAESSIFGPGASAGLPGPVLGSGFAAGAIADMFASADAAAMSYAETLALVNEAQGLAIASGAGWTEQMERQASALVTVAQAAAVAAAQQQALADVTQLLASGFAQLGADMIFSAVAGLQANSSFKQVLAQLGRSAAAQALYELAVGWAATTPWGFAIYGSPHAHFRAAAVFGSAAGALAIASRVAGSGGGVSGSAAAQQSSALARPATSTPAAPPPRELEVTIFIDGQGFVQNIDEFARTTAAAIERQLKRAGAA